MYKAEVANNALPIRLLVVHKPILNLRCPARAVMHLSLKCWPRGIDHIVLLTVQDTGVSFWFGFFFFHFLSLGYQIIALSI